MTEEGAQRSHFSSWALGGHSQKMMFDPYFSSDSEENSYSSSGVDDFYPSAAISPPPALPIIANSANGKYFTSPNFSAGTKREAEDDDDGPSSFKRLRSGRNEGDKYPQLSDDAIKNYSSPGVFEIGKRLFNTNAVTTAILYPQQSQIHAHVRSSHSAQDSKAIERVKISFSGGAIIGASCTCTSLDAKRINFSFCQHTVAVLLQISADSSTLVSYDDLQKQVSNMPREQLNALALNLISQYGGVDLLKHYRQSAGEVSLSVRVIEQMSRAVGSLDTIREITKESLYNFMYECIPYTHSFGAVYSDDEYDSDSESSNHDGHHLGITDSNAKRRSSTSKYGVMEALRARELLNSVTSQIRLAVKKRDDPNAMNLITLFLATEESLRAVEEMPSESKPRWFLQIVGDTLQQMWIEFLVAIPFSKADRDSWREKMEQWEKKYASAQTTVPGLSMQHAIAFLKHGWEDPNLVRLLKGEKDVSFQEHPAITTARLQFLEKNARTEEAINLARAMKVDRNRVLEDLLLVGRVDEAVEEALKNSKSIEETYTLGKRVRESHPIGAFKLVRKALQLSVRNGEEGHYHRYHYGSSTPIKDLVMWLCNHAHECDLFMKSNSGIGPMNLLPREETDEKRASPKKKKAPIDLTKGDDSDDPIDLANKRISDIPAVLMELDLRVSVTTPKALVPSLFDLCMSVIADDYAENMNDSEQQELENELPITMQAALMMESSVRLAIQHLRVEDLYQLALFLQKKDRQFLALRVGLAAAAPSDHSKEKMNDSYQVVHIHNVHDRNRREPPSMSLRVWVMKNSIASKHTQLIEKAVECCSVSYRLDEPLMNVKMCQLLVSLKREKAALDLAVSTANKTTSRTSSETTRVQLADYICTLLKSLSADEMMAYVTNMKANGKPPLGVLFAIAKLFHEKGLLVQGFNLAVECLDLEDVAAPEASYYTSMAYRLGNASLANRPSAVKRECAKWVAQVSEQLGCVNRGIKALVLLAKADPTVENYRRVKELTLKSEDSEYKWDDIRNEMLTAMQSSSTASAQDRIAIFAAENRQDLIIDLINERPSIKLFKCAVQALDKLWTADLGKSLATRFFKFIWLDVWTTRYYGYMEDDNSTNDLGTVWEALHKFASPLDLNLSLETLKVAFVDIIATARQMMVLQASATHYGRLVGSLLIVQKHYVAARRPASDWVHVIRSIRERHSKKGKLMSMLESRWPNDFHSTISLKS